MDRIADNIPEFADRVAEIRAKAAEALTSYAADAPPDDWAQDRIATAYDTETGEVLDTVAQKVAERRGAAPRDTPTQDESVPG
jgi:hypothetical protein